MSQQTTQPLFVNQRLLFPPINPRSERARTRNVLLVTKEHTTRTTDKREGDEPRIYFRFLGLFIYFWISYRLSTNGNIRFSLALPLEFSECSRFSLSTSFPHALPRFARRGPDRSISITSLHHSKHGPWSFFFYRPYMTLGGQTVSSRSYPLCGVHNNTPLAVVMLNTPSYAVLSTPSGAGRVATHK
jgi:hypothetical protein